MQDQNVDPQPSAFVAEARNGPASSSSTNHLPDAHIHEQTPNGAEARYPLRNLLRANGNEALRADAEQHLQREGRQAEREAAIQRIRWRPRWLPPVERRRLDQALYHARVGWGWHADLRGMAAADPRAHGRLAKIFIRDHYRANPEIQQLHALHRQGVSFATVRRVMQRVLHIEMKRQMNSHSRPMMLKFRAQKIMLDARYPWLERLTEEGGPLWSYLRTGQSFKPHGHRQ